MYVLQIIEEGRGEKEERVTSPQGFDVVRGDMGWQGEVGGSLSWKFGVTSFIDGP